MIQTPHGPTVTHGALHAQVEAGDFLLTESSYAPGFRTGAHTHARTSLVFGLEGALEQVHGSRAGDLEPRTLLVLPRDVVHADQVGAGGCRCLFVTLDPAKLDAIGYHTPVLRSVRFAQGARIGPIAAALRQESRIDDEVRPMAIEGLVYELIAGLAREPDPGDERSASWLTMLRDRLEENFAGPVSLASLATDLGVHPAYMARAFARRYGTSISSFVRTRRIQWAREQLMYSDESISHIGMLAGFFDQSHFTRCFKRAVGTTPARFRQAHGWSTAS